MAKCKKCGREIAESEEYCVSCKELRDHKCKFWGKVGAMLMAVVGVVVCVATKGKVKIDSGKMA